MSPMLATVLLPEASELAFDAATFPDLPMLRGSDMSMIIAILCDATATILVLLRKIQVPFLPLVLPLRILLVYTYTGLDLHHLSLFSWGLGIVVHAAATFLHLVVEHGAWPTFPCLSKELLSPATAKLGQARKLAHSDSNDSKQTASLNGGLDGDGDPSSSSVCDQHVGVEDVDPHPDPASPATLSSPTLMQSLPQHEQEQQQEGCDSLVASVPASKAAADHQADAEEDARITQMQLDYVQRCLRVPNRGPKYRSSFRHHKVTLKVPCRSGPSSLAPDVLPKFGENIRRMTDTEVLSAVVRAGCILLTADLQETAARAASPRNTPQQLQGALLGGGTDQGTQLERAIAGAAQQWLLDTHLVEQLPHSASVTLQVEDRMFKCQLPDFISSMTLDSDRSGEIPLSICAAAPSILVPGPDPPTANNSEEPASTACQQRSVASPAVSSASSADASAPPSADQHSPGKRHDEAASADMMVVHAQVRKPVGAVLYGWRSRSTAAGDPARGAASALQVLACTRSGYLPTSVEVVPAQSSSPSLGHGQDDSPPEGLEDVQVSISIPAAAAHAASLHTHPSLLRLELWRTHALHSCSTLLLLPASLAGVDAELRQGPLGESMQHEAEFMEDLASWLAVHGSHQPSPSSVLQSPELSTGASGGTAQQQQQQQAASGTFSGPSAYTAERDFKVGVCLLRQAILWDMPCLSTLLVECLMGWQPKAPEFSELVCAGARADQCPHFPPWHEHTHADSVQCVQCVPLPGGPDCAFSIEDLGSLLHLCLLCPRPGLMLAAFLRWGERFAGRDAELQWEKHNRLGLTALDILAGCTREDQGAVLSTLLQRAPAQYACVTRALRQEQQNATPLVQQQVPAHASPASPSISSSPACQQSTHYTKAAPHEHSSSTAPARSMQHSVGLTAARHSLAGALGRNRSSHSEAAYLAWAHNYTLPLSRVRFALLLLGCLVGISRSILNGVFYGDVLLMYSVTAAYLWGVVKKQHKAGTRLARYGHITMWALLGLGILPMENNTKTMVATYSEGFVLFALFSPLLEQATLGYLLLERLSTTTVLSLIFNALGISPHIALIRAVVSNVVSVLAEWLFIDVNLRYVYLKGQLARQPAKAD